LINGIEILGVAPDVQSTQSKIVAIEEKVDFEDDVVEDNLAVSDKDQVGNTLKRSMSSAAMYPNPAAYEVTIQILDPEVIVEEIYIYNFSGVLSRTYTFPKNGESGTYNFDVSTLPSGVYIVKLKTTKNGYINLNLIVKR